MKKILLVMCLALATSVLLAGTSTTTPPAKTSTGMSHHMTVTLVSVDATAKTITVKDEKGENHTAPLMGEALKEMDKIKPGEMLKVTCKDNEKGEHQGVTHISVVKHHNKDKAAPAPAAAGN